MSNNCYPNFRTPFDRMMQTTYASCCKPVPRCDKHGLAMSKNACDERGCQSQSTVEFYSDESEELDVVVLAPSWCGYSKKLSAQTQNLKSLLKKHGANVHMMTNADDPVFKQLAKEFGVKGFPHSVALKNKKVVKHSSGYKEPRLLVAELLS